MRLQMPARSICEPGPPSWRNRRGHQTFAARETLVIPSRTVQSFAQPEPAMRANMNRRTFVKIGALASAPLMVTPIFARPAGAAAEPPSFRIKPFEWEEATIAQLQAAMKAGKETAVSLAKKYLQRIEEV